jgi:hypothetical protein
LLEGQVTAADPDDDGVFLDLKEDSLSIVSVNALSLSFELHMPAHFVGLLVDDLGQFLVNPVRLAGDIGKRFLLLDQLLQVSFLLTQFSVQLKRLFVQGLQLRLCFENLARSFVNKLLHLFLGLTLGPQLLR